MVFKSEIEILRDKIEKESDNGVLMNTLGKALFKMVYFNFTKRKIIKKLNIICAKQLTSENMISKHFTF